MKDFTILTKEDAVRALDSARYNPAIDSGYFGRVTENQCARPKSRKSVSAPPDKLMFMSSTTGAMSRQK